MFLCTGNSARSIMAEAIMNFRGKPQFTAYSAGSHPTGAVRPEALREIENAHIPTTGLRSKSWEEFRDPAHLGSILFSRYATTLRKKFVPCGPDIQ